MKMLLPSFNFIGGKEIMKLLRNFHLTKVKQNFFLFLRGEAFKNDRKAFKYRYVYINKYA